MEIRPLRYFAAVAHEGSMTRAAAQLHVSQPTLSKQVKSLERELGHKLFTRHSFHMELTEEGRLLRERADDLIRLADRIESDFLALADVTGGDLRLGLAESHQVGLLARQIKRLKRSCPGLRYHITSGDTEQVTEKLDRGLLDFAAIVEDPDERGRGDYEVLPLPVADTWGVVMRRDDALAGIDAVTVDDLAGLPLFCSEQSWTRDIPAWAGAAPGGDLPTALQRVGVRPRGPGPPADLRPPGGHERDQRPGLQTAGPGARVAHVPDLAQRAGPLPHRRAVPGPGARLVVAVRRRPAPRGLSAARSSSRPAGRPRGGPTGPRARGGRRAPRAGRCPPR